MGQAADVHHHAGQLAGVFLRLHERAVAVFYVQHDGVGAGGDFLAHNGAGNERDAFDGPRRVAQGVEQLICRGDVAGLGNEGKAHAADLLQKLVFRQLNAKSRNGFQLIRRAACKSQAPAAHFRHRHAGSSD